MSCDIAESHVAVLMWSHTPALTSWGWFKFHWRHSPTTIRVTALLWPAVLSAAQNGTETLSILNLPNMSAQNVGLCLRHSATELSSPTGASAWAGEPATAPPTSGQHTRRSSSEPGTSDQVRLSGGNWEVALITPDNILSPQGWYPTNHEIG